MNIVIASGKGGTGKTMMAVNLAYYLSANNKQRVKLLDCDVDAPNDNIFVKAKFSKIIDVKVPRPVCDEAKCLHCGSGKCVEVCQFNAIAMVKNNTMVFNELCHSCGACVDLCPVNALKMKGVSIGKIKLAPKNVPFFFGQGVLKIGEKLSPIIVNKLKEQITNDYINIIDASPGISCSVVKAMEGMDYCLLVAEPTPFGLNDLRLIVSLVVKMQLFAGIIINKSYNDNYIIEDFANKHNIPILGKIPFSKKYAESYSNGEILINKHVELRKTFNNIYKSMLKIKKIPKEIIYRNNLRKTTDIKKLKNNKKTTSNYNEIVVISGKGGTGKTTITAALSELLKDKILADADVDTSNLYLLCKPSVIEYGNFIGGKKYIINQQLCIKCGLCAKKCYFDAIQVLSNNVKKTFKINELACIGCGFCSYICKPQAIFSKNFVAGKWYISNTDKGLLSHAKLGIGEENSGKLVSTVRDNAIKLAQSNNIKQILIDGPPGTGCPTISSITGVSLAIIVTEPTLSGFSDLQRIIELIAQLNIKSLIVINKYDLNIDITKKIIKLTSANKINIIGQISFDKNINDALMRKKNIIQYKKGKAYMEIMSLWDNLQKEISNL